MKASRVVSFCNTERCREGDKVRDMSPRFVMLSEASRSAHVSASSRSTRKMLGLVFGLSLAALLAACGTPPTGRAPPPPSSPTVPPKPPLRDPEMAAFRAELSGHQVVPRSDSAAQGQLVAILNRKTGLFRWKLSYEGMSGPVRGARFHGPAMEGEVANPRVMLGRGNVSSPSEGSATLTPSQRADLLMGQWYVNLTTARYPEGEVRGQLIEQR